MDWILASVGILAIFVALIVSAVRRPAGTPPAPPPAAGEGDTLARRVRRLEDDLDDLSAQVRSLKDDVQYLMRQLEDRG